MKRLIKLINRFQERNNLSVFAEFYSDGSCCLREYWDEDIIQSFENTEHLLEFLKKTYLEKDESGVFLFRFSYE